MRILMLSCNTGEGHNSTAKAIMGVLTERGVECHMEDGLACLSPRCSKFVCNWHTRLYKYAPKIFDVTYRACERNIQEPEDAAFLYDILALGAKKLWGILMEGSYDAVICTHVFASLMMTELRRNWGSKEPCFFVDTDYTVYPFLDGCDMDGYFIPGKDLVEDFVRGGFPQSKLIPSGIPVRPEFYTHGSVAEIREELGLPADAVVILLMCGSMGCGPIRKLGEDLVKNVPENAIVVAICGKNEKLYEAMSYMQSERLRVLGYTRNMADYMDAADLIVTKPGGLSSTEAANKHLPMVLINVIGGCEARNFERFLERGYALGSKEPDEVVRQTVYLATHAEERAKMVERLREDFRENSAMVIADHVMQAAFRFRSITTETEKRIHSEDSGHPQEKGGCDMEFLKSETQKNLARSFAGESQARTRYTIYAKEARKEGYEWIARVFEETAANEAVHAEEFLEMMQKMGGNVDNLNVDAGYPFQLGDTCQNLGFAASGELEEHSQAYPAFAELARREGFEEAAHLWQRIASIEGVHHNTFKSLQMQMMDGSLTRQEEPVVWRCLNCGYTYESMQAAMSCPVCSKGAGWQEGMLEERKLMPKK